MNATDGPYIFYTDDAILVRSVIDKNGVPVLQTQLLNPSQRNGFMVNCLFNDHPNWNFSIPLKETLSPEPCIFPPASRILALSDIEGNFEAFRELLLANGVIDTAYNWTFGNGHLVLNGDCFDRGDRVTECLWLLYGLEEKARQQGGYVHFILGNHELMIMGNDTRYVHEKYLDNARLFLTDYPLLFTPATELGRWLATKNMMEKIGPWLFVHGGISPAVNALGLSIDKLNGLCRPWYFTPRFAVPPAQEELYHLLYSDECPFWYRGYALGHATSQQVRQTLSQFEVSRIVIGHTTVDRVTAFFNGAVIDIDTPHAAGISEALLIENGQPFVTDRQGLRREL